MRSYVEGLRSFCLCEAIWTHPIRRLLNCSAVGSGTNFLYAFLNTTLILSSKFVDLSTPRLKQNPTLTGSKCPAQRSCERFSGSAPSSQRSLPSSQNTVSSTREWIGHDRCIWVSRVFENKPILPSFVTLVESLLCGGTEDSLERHVR